MNVENFISEASFWLPELLIPSPWIEHAPFVFWLTAIHRPALFLELGPNCSYSYFLFNQAFKTFGIQARSFAVDTRSGDEYARTEAFPELRAYGDKSYWHLSEFIRSTFDEAAGRFANHTIDLIHFDNLRSYEDARRDFETWKPKLSTRGIVLLHNTNRLTDFGVDQLWNELKAEYPHFEFVHGNGLGVLNVGDQISDALAPLFTALHDELLTKAIRHTYSRLGGSLSDKIDLRQIAAKLTELTTQVTVRDELLATQNQEVAQRYESQVAKDRLLEERWVELENLTAALALRDNLIARKDHLIALRDDIILAKDNLLEKLHVELQNLTAEVAVRDELIAQRDDLLAVKDESILVKDRLLDERYTQLQNLSAELAANDELITKHDSLITAMNNNNRALNKLLEDRSDALQALAVELARRDQLIAQKDQSITTKLTVIEQRDHKLQRLSDQRIRAEAEIVRQHGLLMSSLEELSMTKRILSSNSEELTLAKATIQKLKKNWLSRIRMSLKLSN